MKKQHPRRKSRPGNEKKGPTDRHLSHKQSDKTKVKVEGSRKVWGTMKSTSASTMSNAIKSLSDVDVDTLTIQRKYQNTLTNRKSKWWFVIRGEESSLKNLDVKWEPIALHTSWKLELLLRFDDTITDSTTTTDGASKDAADEIGTVHTQTKDPALQDDMMPTSEANPHAPESVYVVNPMSQVSPTPHFLEPM